MLSNALLSGIPEGLCCRLSHPHLLHYYHHHHRRRRRHHHPTSPTLSTHPPTTCPCYAHANALTAPRAHHNAPHTHTHTHTHRTCLPNPPSAYISSHSALTHVHTRACTPIPPRGSGPWGGGQVRQRTKDRRASSGTRVSERSRESRRCQASGKARTQGTSVSSVFPRRLPQLRSCEVLDELCDGQEGHGQQQGRG
jgi:hypothetical protein